jgi:hypothetical protein
VHPGTDTSVITLVVDARAGGVTMATTRMPCGWNR